MRHLRWALCLSVLPCLAQAQPTVGYGSTSVGGSGAGSYVCTVTNTNNAGAGSLRQCILDQSNRLIVQFSVGGTITLLSDIDLRTAYLTIDGTTAPSPGITIKKDSQCGDGTIVVRSGHDYIIKGLRFDGSWVIGTTVPDCQEACPLGVDEDSGVAAQKAWDDDYSAASQVRRLVIDQCSMHNSIDNNPDLWCQVRDVTVSRNLFYDSKQVMTVSCNNETVEKQRERISLFKNVWAYNKERQPQLRMTILGLEYVNNILYAYTGHGIEAFAYGLRLRDDGAPEPFNIMNNYFINSVGTSAALDSCWTQCNDNAFDHHFAGNIFPAGYNANGTTGCRSIGAGVSGPYDVPAYAELPMIAAADLEQILSEIGAPFPTARETEIKDEIATIIPGNPDPPPTTPAAPGQPSISYVVVAAVLKANLVWADNSDNETGFKVRLRVGDGAYTLQTTTAADATTYQSAAELGSVNCFEIVGTNAGGDGDASMERCLKAPDVILVGGL